MIPEFYKRNKGRVIRMNGELAIVCGHSDQSLILAVISGFGIPMSYLVNYSHLHIYTHKNNKLGYWFYREISLGNRPVINIKIS